jgi:ribosomal protein S18 acetylase RimI-like enzyme
MIEVREASAPDALAAVRELFLEYAASLPVGLEYQDFESEVAQLPADYASPAGTLLLATDASAPIACVGVRPIDAITCELKRLYVRPAGRGQGLGRRLTLAAVTFARGAGYTAMRLDTLPSMTEAQRLYRALGFIDIAAYRFSPVEGNVYLELDLTRTSA